jgi:Arc/MetJ-type ribon-helix-helix transcriptional regulator
MELQLSGKAEEIVREKLALGIYANAADFVSEIILRADEFDKLKLENLRQALRIGIDQLNRGEGRPLDIGRINEEINHASKQF